MADTIARHYDASKNEEGAALPGVPLADIDEATFESYPQWLKDSIDAAPFYRKTKPTAERPSRARAETDKEG
jgi:hypothetical protein